MSPLYPDQDYLLLRQLREGSIQSFNLLYEKYWEPVYDQAFRRLKDRDRAQDITQDIFTRLWIKRNELSIDNLPAYLHVSVRNRVLNLFEKERRYIPFEELLARNMHLYGDRADAEALRHEFLKAYHALVEAMPAGQQSIFRYYYEEGLTTAEIADCLQISRKTVQNQLGRAVATLRANLSHLFFLLIILTFTGQ
ncbi:RNA polymerase sigma factor [Compostibacter hankyongensis]